MQAMKLADVRKLMTARGIASAGSLEAARKIVGSANSREPFLRNMSVALSLMTWRNTAEDWQRLEATLMVRAVKRKASTIATAN